MILFVLNQLSATQAYRQGAEVDDGTDPSRWC